MNKIEFYKHNLTLQDIKECEQVLNSLFLTTGAVVKKFEEDFSRYTRQRFTIGVSSCTAALFLALKRYDIGPGDEVITTPMTFIATANVVEHCGAKPVFVDVEDDTGNLDARKIEAVIGPRTKAIIPVHLYGQMCDMRSISTIARRHNLRVIEDCAHCIEGVRDGVRVGEVSDAACFSFYATKNITSGEGGAITCNDEESAHWYSCARSHGMTKNAAQRYEKLYEHWDMQFLGYKANLTNIQASLLLHQLERIEDLWKARQRIAQAYISAFTGKDYLKLHALRSDTKHAHHLFTVLTDPRSRDRHLGELQKAGIGVVVNYRAVHLLDYYRKKYSFTRGTFPHAELIGDSTITIPLYPRLEEDEVAYVIEQVSRICSN
jgi:dTDP-4-amino-4,6-dideoxygalactose transaminase